MLFVVFARHAIPGFTLRGLEAFAKAGCNVTALVNGRLSPAVLDALKPHCWRIVHRANVGQDFGAWKDGVLDLFAKQKAGMALTRIVIANDSNFYFARGLDAMIAALLDDEPDFVGVTETYAVHYHVQSFLLSFSARVIESGAFRAFWRAYLPVGTRHWAIHNGEVALTRALMRKGGFAPQVMFTAPDLAPKLAAMGAEDLHEAVQLMPRSFREPRAETLAGLWREPARQAADALQALAKQKRASIETDANLTALKSTAFENARIAANEARARLIREMIENIALSNQMHVGGFLFCRCLGMAIIKRDIVYRGIYSTNEALHFLHQEGLDGLDEIAVDFRRKGLSIYHTGLARFMFDHGLI